MTRIRIAVRRKLGPGLWKSLMMETLNVSSGWHLTLQFSSTNDKDDNRSAAKISVPSWWGDISRMNVWSAQYGSKPNSDSDVSPFSPQERI